MQIKELFEEASIISFEKKKLEKKLPWALQRGENAINYLKELIRAFESENFNVIEFSKILEQIENSIARDGLTSYVYARDLMPRIYHDEGRRFEKGEPMIARNATTAYNYARDILQSPWSAFDIPKPIAGLAEYTIAQEPVVAFRYASDILKKPWKDSGLHPRITMTAETGIYGDKTLGPQYKEFVKKSSR